jgi:DNA-binding NarL/FixJ family response regulator
MKYRILICDDHKIFREGLRALLEKQPDVKVVGEARDGQEALKLAQDLAPDIVVMDISMPGMNGIDASRALAKTRKTTQIIALSMHGDRNYVAATFKAGARAYLLKDLAFEELMDAIKAVSNGKFFLSADIANLVMGDYIKGPAGDPVSVLSSREREILQMLADGLCTKEISHKLLLSVKTVETHRKRIMGKTGIRNIAGLTHYAIREGLVNL